MGNFEGLTEGESIPNVLSSTLSAKITYVGGTTHNEAILSIVNGGP